LPIEIWALFTLPQFGLLDFMAQNIGPILKKANGANKVHDSFFCEYKIAFGWSKSKIILKVV
jgi:hypothetical protein